MLADGGGADLQHCLQFSDGRFAMALEVRQDLASRRFVRVERACHSSLLCFAGASIAYISGIVNLDRKNCRNYCVLGMFQNRSFGLDSWGWFGGGWRPPLGLPRSTKL